jgi:hypothetical protein
LSFVIASAILVGLAKVTQCDGAINCRDDVGETNVGGWFSQHVSAPYASFRTHKSGSLEGKEDLLKIGLREACALGNVTH